MPVIDLKLWKQNVILKKMYLAIMSAQTKP